MSENVLSTERPAEEPLAGEIAVDPATGRPAGRAQALVLLLSSCLAVLGAVLLAPVLPRIQDAFATPGVEALAPVVLTAPALVIGLTAMIAGRIVDRVGRKRLLVGALVVYAFVGTAPLWLPSLELIVASRVLLGLTEAAIMTCCTTLLADYFHGSQRERYFGLQVVFTTVAATVFFGVGGALGAADWRTPFWLYAVSLPLAVAAAKLIWQPAPRVQAAARAQKLPALPWRRLAAPIGVSLVGGLVFYVLIVQLSFKLDDIGVESTAVIGAASAIASVGTAVGGILFGRLARRGPAVLVPLAFAVSGVGIVGLGLSSAVPAVIAFAVITGFGNGLILPSLLTWALGSLSFEQRGRGTGVWTSAFFIGQFFCPLVVLALTGALGGLGTALALLGAVSLAAAAGVRFARPTPVAAAH
ncbi:Predicted arabinose efflux permease, MFS family [Geodermatophilus amargosae]|uniref:Predicted arabinose efflux permease, MFS family n=1 Tax=Geodermatophilus amargosae TaxID=1296565 RepID=A0A1I6ZTQ1_9ACTN|nr:MFS transporter [Geodermatophilus amargosae]SFT65985.1 Predicted arabinose efflux permease, MFS family [Geodermatophilus amargosae]